MWSDNGTPDRAHSAHSARMTPAPAGCHPNMPQHAPKRPQKTTQAPPEASPNRFCQSPPMAKADPSKASSTEACSVRLVAFNRASQAAIARARALPQDQARSTPLASRHKRCCPSIAPLPQLRAASHRALSKLAASREPLASVARPAFLGLLRRELCCGAANRSSASPSIARGCSRAFSALPSTRRELPVQSRHYDDSLDQRGGCRASPQDSSPTCRQACHYLASHPRRPHQERCRHPLRGSLYRPLPSPPRQYVDTQILAAKQRGC